SDNVVDRIIRLSNGGVGPGQVAIGCAPFHLSRQTWHAIDIYRFPNGVIQVFMDNEATPRMEGFDSSVSASGAVALRAVVAGVRFDNVSFDPTLPANPPLPSAGSCPTWGGLDPSCGVGGTTTGGNPVRGLDSSGLVMLAALLALIGVYALRSEERRVGKECRSEGCRW